MNAAQDLFILQFGARRVLVKSPVDYDALQQSVRRHFPEIPAGYGISYQTKDLPISEGTSVEVSPDVWGTVIPMLKKLVVHATPDASSPAAGIGKRRIKEEEKNEGLSSDGR